ncbi:STAS domain-containing protein [Desulfovibrio gilichinskyi]|uniref:Anti-anti-sigma regulatory factor (Antagonist of anti-sigma factor) n=1 Tax=Desulfovibrio gilichinskyi TaxID=1519643 RepID=A0A1X7CAK9_9BACT|nr:STAS domain-containing protein [Desulfovibrio gilichinskyi]SME92928.1 Anti-anti-sigma regulatory factor (antagonist of anti-sigma factor) [Desulfovibrio gilichinskyi]
MNNFIESSQIRIAFGIPFDSLDFHELLVAVGELAASGKKHFIFAASFPWILEYGRNPLNRLNETDIFIAADSNIIGLAEKLGQTIKMPIEYFEFPEQIALICAHYGFRLLHVSSTALKTDILVRDGYVPLSWDLFTNFKISDCLDEKHKDSIISSAVSSKPDIILISASPDNLRTYIPEIHKNIPNCLLICTPKDETRSTLSDRIRNIISPLILARQETCLLRHMTESCANSIQSSVSYDDKSEQSVIRVSGVLSSRVVSDLRRIGKKVFRTGKNLELDLSSTTAVSIKGLEEIFYLHRLFKNAGKKFFIREISPEALTLFHQSGIASFFDNIPGIADDMDIENMDIDTIDINDQN